MAIVTKMNLMLSLALRRLSPHGITSATSRRSWSCYFSSVSAPRDDDEDWAARFSSSWKCIGSSHGWLGYVSPGVPGGDWFCLFKPSLLNHPSYLPFIPLPPLKNHNISKMIFSSTPTPFQRQARDNDTHNSSVLVVLTLDCGSHGAAFCRMGDPGWTFSSNFPVSQMQMPMKKQKYLCSYNSFQDIAYDSKHNLFYVITISGEIYSWDLSNYRYCSISRSQDCSFQYLSKPPTTEFPPPKLGDGRSLNQGIKYYLVMDESSRSLLLIRVLIYYTEYDDCDLPLSKSYIHDMHCIDVDNKLDPEWFPIRGLVDTALFIGRNNGVAVDARKFPGLVTPGYIYLACNDFGIFQLTALRFSRWGDLSSKNVMKILRADEMSKIFKSSPVWNFE